MKKLILLLLSLGIAGYTQTGANVTFPTKTFTSATTSTAVSNRMTTSGGAAGAISWTFRYYTNNATGVSVQVEGANDLNGAPTGSWTTLTATGGSNPATGTGEGEMILCCDYYPWIRVNVTTLTGTSPTLTILGYGYVGTQNVAASTGAGLLGPVDTTITPAMMLSPPYYDPAQTGPGITMIAGVPGKIIIPLVMETYTTTGTAWAQADNPVLGFTSPGAGLTLDVVFTEFSSLSDFCPDPDPPYWFRITLGQYRNLYPIFWGGTTGGVLNDPPFTPDVVGKPLILWSVTDPSNAGAQFGDRSIVVRVYYQLQSPVPPFTPPTQNYLITAVDQGTKTFTVSGDASALTGNIAVTGSTGNNGTYTVVSATFGVSTTDIVVSQAIPSATADGWIAHS